MKVYDRNVVNKYRIYFLLGVIIYNLIDFISIRTDAELLISLYIYIVIIYIFMSFFESTLFTCAKRRPCFEY